MQGVRYCIQEPKKIAIVWRVIFVGANLRGKPENALKINFCGFKFRDSNQSRGVALHKRYVIDAHARSRSRSSLLLTHTYRDLDK